MVKWHRLFSALSVVLAQLPAHAQSDVESQIRDRAMIAAKGYDRAQYYTYAPKGSPSETQASTVSSAGHIFLEAYRFDRDGKWLEKARVAGDSLVANGDRNNDGKIGWGRFWPGDPKSASAKGDGANTTFALECKLPRNKPYDDEMYDNARIGHFLLDLYDVTRDNKYLNAVDRMLADTWKLVGVTPEGAVYYSKTAGDCDQGWHIKNINMLMAVPMARMAQLSGRPIFAERARSMIAAEVDELRFMSNGRQRPNFGYYARHTMRERASMGPYVKIAQIGQPDGTVACRADTSTGESCMEHVGIEARSLDLALRAGVPGVRGTVDDVRTLMLEHEHLDPVLCSTGKTFSGAVRSASVCAAYFCALRRLKSAYAERCLERTANSKSWTLEVILGFFWGRAGRFEAAR
jgi:hypothetical protein